jgi:hypothetical protein
VEANEFIDLIESPEKAKEKGIDELKKLAKDYPYSQPIQLLYAIRLRKSSEHLFSQQLGKTSILTNDRSVLFDLFEQGRVEERLAPEQFEEEIKEHQKFVTADEPIEEKEAVEEEEHDVFSPAQEEYVEEPQEETLVTVASSEAEPEEAETPEESEEASETVANEDADEVEEEAPEEKPKEERNISALPADERIKAILEKNRQLREEFERKKQTGDSPLSEMDLRLKGIREKLETLKKPKEEKEEPLAEEVKNEASAVAPVEQEPSVDEAINAQQETEEVDEAQAHVSSVKEVDELDHESQEEGLASYEEVVSNVDKDEFSQAEADELERDEVFASEDTESIENAADQEEPSIDELTRATDDTQSDQEDVTTQGGSNLLAELQEDIKGDLTEDEVLSEPEPVFEVHANEIEKEETAEVAVEDQETSDKEIEEESIPFGLDERESDVTETNVIPPQQEEQQMSFGDWLKKLNKSGGSSVEKLEGSKQGVSNLQAEIPSFEEKAQLLDSFVEKLPDLKKKKIEVGPTKTPIEIGELVNQGEVSLVTETLAKVYIQQKHYGKAIKAYEILKLKYPEKSSFFAARISEVKNLKNTK